MFSLSIQVAKIKNEAKEFLENAKLQSDLVLNQAEINYTRVIEGVHNNGKAIWNHSYSKIVGFYFLLFKGLQKIFNDLGFTSNKHKSSLNYIRTLKNHEKVKYSIDFNTLVATAGGA